MVKKIFSPTTECFPLLERHTDQQVAANVTFPARGCKKRCGGCSDYEQYFCNNDGTISLMQGPTCSSLTEVMRVVQGSCYDREAIDPTGGDRVNPSSWRLTCQDAFTQPDEISATTVRIRGWMTSARTDPNVPCSGSDDELEIAVDLDLSLPTSGCVEFDKNLFNKLQCSEPPAFAPMFFDCGNDSACLPESCTLVDQAFLSDDCDSTSQPGVDMKVSCLAPPDSATTPSQPKTKENPDGSVELSSASSSTSLTAYWIGFVLVLLCVLSLYKRASAALSRQKYGDKAVAVSLATKISSDHSFLGICFHVAGDSFSSFPRCVLFALHTAITLLTTIIVLLINPDNVDAVTDGIAASLGAILLSSAVSSTLTLATGSELLRKAMIGKGSHQGGRSPIAPALSIAVILTFILFAAAAASFVLAKDSASSALDLASILVSSGSSLVIHILVTEPFFITVKYFAWRESFIVLPLATARMIGPSTTSKVSPGPSPQNPPSDSLSDSLSDKDPDALKQELRLLRRQLDHPVRADGDHHLYAGDDDDHTHQLYSDDSDRSE